MSDQARERLQELQKQYGKWGAQDPGHVLRQRDLLERQAHRDDNEAENLCMILNWTAEKVAIVEGTA